jgi:hypothetical protein
LGNGYPCHTLMYRMDISRPVEWTKLSPSHLLPLSLSSGFVLVAPNNVLDVFALLDLAGNKRG